MRLILSSERVRNTIITNESGQVLYKTTHPLSLTGTTTIHKIKPRDDLMDMRDQFEAMAEIEWHVTTPTIFRFNGEELPADKFIPRHGIRGRKRTFTGPDGRPYRWDMPWATDVLSTDDENRTELARYHVGTLGLTAPRVHPYLEVHPDAVHMLDHVVLTFVYVEKIHMDKHRARPMSHAGSGGGTSS